jgi:hypothetical protein
MTGKMVSRPARGDGIPFVAKRWRLLMNPPTLVSTKSRTSRRNVSGPNSGSVICNCHQEKKCLLMVFPIIVQSNKEKYFNNPKIQKELFLALELSTTYLVTFETSNMCQFWCKSKL